MTYRRRRPSSRPTGFDSPTAKRTCRHRRLPGPPEGVQLSPLRRHRHRRTLPCQITPNSLSRSRQTKVITALVLILKDDPPKQVENSANPCSPHRKTPKIFGTWICVQTVSGSSQKLDGQYGGRGLQCNFGCVRVCTTLYQNPIYVFPEMKLHGLIPNSYIHVSLSGLYIPRIALPIWMQQTRQTDPGNI